VDSSFMPDGSPGAPKFKPSPAAPTSGVLVASGSALTAVSAASLPPTSDFDFTPSGDMKAWTEAIEERRTSMKLVKKNVQKMQKQLNMRKLVEKAEELSYELKSAQKRLARHQQTQGEGGEDNWQSFMQHVKVLTQYGALESDSLMLTPLGQAVAEVRGDNELWLAAALLQVSVCVGLTAPELAALVSALLCPETLNKDFMHCTWGPSPQVTQAVVDIEPARMRLQALQEDAGIFSEVAIDLRLAGLVEAWASGVEWVDVMESTNLDEGDVVRVLRRTADFLTQIKCSSGFSGSIMKNASDAAKLIDRPPISDLLIN